MRLDVGLGPQVRLEPAELEAVDRLITAGVAASRAEARWAGSARPGYSLPRFLEDRMIWVTR